jgi:quercetin dioxygenase-like cupin family protein
MTIGHTTHEIEGMKSETLATLDLDPDAAGGAGRRLRMRLITIGPGSRSSRIDHMNTAGIAYVVRGTITEHRDGSATEYAVGRAWSIDGDAARWLENRGAITAMKISVEVLDRTYHHPAE